MAMDQLCPSKQKTAAAWVPRASEFTINARCCWVESTRAQKDSSHANLARRQGRSMMRLEIFPAAVITLD